MLLAVTVIAVTFIFEVFLQYQATSTTFSAESALFRKANLVREFRKAGRTIWPTAHPRVLVAPKMNEIARLLSKINTKNGLKTSKGYLLPLGSISNTNLMYCNEGYGDVVYQSDEHGFRNPKGLWNPGDVDILAVGDSYTDGACVPNGDSFVDVIRQDFSKMINIGSSSNGPILELAGLREYGSRLRPRVVVWFFYVNDFSDVTHEIKSDFIRRYLNDPNFTQSLIDRQDEIDAALMKFQTEALELVWSRWEEKSRNIIMHAVRDTLLLRRLRHMIKVVFSDRSDRQVTPRDKKPIDRDMSVSLFERALGEADALVKSWGGRLVLVHLPTKTTTKEKQKTDIDDVTAVSKKTGVPLLTLHDTFFAQPNVESLFPPIAGILKIKGHNGHYSIKGHHLVGETVSKWIKDLGLLTTKQ